MYQYLIVDMFVEDCNQLLVIQLIYYNYLGSDKMYQPETSYEDFLKSEQEKYPELNLKDIEVLTERLKANVDLPPLRGTIL